MQQDPPHIFFRSQPMACPYLQNRSEYQLFTRISRSLSPQEALFFSNAGFRRSHNIIYRPICPNCSSCISTRIRTYDFKLTGSWQRILNKNKDISRESSLTDITYEQYELFRQYVSARHSQGEMANMSFQEYADMVLQSPLDSFLTEYRINGNNLAGVCILDKLPDGYSAVYSFYNTLLPERSLGSLMILDLIALCQTQNLPYLYLGYWVKESPKMDYKKRFRPLEGYVDNVWKTLHVDE